MLWEKSRSPKAVSSIECKLPYESRRRTRRLIVRRTLRLRLQLRRALINLNKWGLAMTFRFFIDFLLLIFLSIGRLFFVLGLMLAATTPIPVQAADDRTPTVLIPGILGSKLCDGDTVVWGALSSLSNFQKLDALSEYGKKLKPCGILKKIEILGPFWATDGYNSLLNQLSDLGYQDGKDLLVFDYDWRRSNFVTAKLLKDAIDNNPNFRGRRFQIVAHSMGGLVARILLQNPEIAERVERVVYLGTPFQGSADSLGIISNGWGSFANLVAGGIEAIRHTALSFTSIYELLPRYSKCCRVGDPQNPSGLVILPTLLDTSLWTKYDWLPEEYRNGDRAPFVAQSIDSARHLQEVVEKPQTNVDEILIAGTGNETRLYLYVDKADKSWRKWHFSVDKGDGTVPLWSASAGDVSKASPAFAPHASIFEDKWVAERLTWLLSNPQPPPIRGPIATIETVKHEQKTIDRASIAVTPDVSGPNKPLSIKVTLIADDRLLLGEVAPEITLDTGDHLKLVETTTPDQLETGVHIFEGKVTGPSVEGPHRVDANFGPSARISGYFYIQP